MEASQCKYATFDDEPLETTTLTAPPSRKWPRFAQAASLVLLSLWVVAVVQGVTRAPSSSAAELTEVSDCANGAWMDDSLTPESCGGFDATQCGLHCGAGDCQNLCGEACQVGSGAVCALSIFEPTTFKKTCTDLGYCDGVFLTDTDLTAAPDLGTGTGTGACDNHAWCLLCAPYETCVHVTASAAGAMAHLSELETHCYNVGCGLDV
ncbi:hypothetical protein M885DRAFT_615065 [Pelagophyceae sp. CCMP2097]|nr:hypothetical protein M885DRAFT_615065 [Pelagophyceae sp. CCMP2097]